MVAEQLEICPDRMTDQAEDARMSRRVVAAGVSRPPRLPPDAAPSWQQPHALNVHIVAAWFEVLAQLVITCTQWRNSESKGSLLAFTAAKFALSAFVLGWPGTFWAHRLAVMPLMRIAMHLLPHVRRTGVGAALMLERAARPGLAGVASDAARVMAGSAGTRQLGLAVSGVILTLPPALTLLQQGTLLWLTTNNAAYCSTQLLSDPLTQRRAASLATALEFVATPMLVLQPLASPAQFELATRLLAGQASTDRVCRATLSFAHLCLCVLLPLVLSVYHWQPEGGEGRPPASTDETAASGWRGLPARATQGCSKAVSAADRSLTRLLRTPVHCGSRLAVAAWWLLAVCWLACKHAAGLR